MERTCDRLLVVDDELGVSGLIAEIAEGLGFEVAQVHSAEALRAAYRDLAPDVVVLDLVMPGVDGVELLGFLADEGSEAQVLLISGLDTRVLSTSERLGLSHGLRMLGRLQKPIDLGELEELLGSAMPATPRPAAASVRRGSLVVDELREAIAHDQLVVYYQPKATLGPDGVESIDAVEALVRWAHPARGIVMPGDFIGLAEKNGLIGPLTEAVVRKAMEQIHRWDVAGLTLDLAINLAPQILEDKALPDRLLESITGYRLDPSRIHLEITESAAMENTARSMEILARFRVKGFAVSMDDFGTGYSSLVQLYRMPFNELKIDRSFVMEMDRSNEARTIVHSTIELAHNLGLEVCAEGVEAEATLSWLCAAGCDRAQGYLISRPVPASEIGALVKTWRGEVHQHPAALLQ